MKKIFTTITFTLFLFLSNSLKAQITTSSQWTWVKGDNTANAPGIYGNQGVASIANKSGARSGSVSWTDAAGNFWLFGGSTTDRGDGYQNDLWKYNPTTNQWTWTKGDSTANQPGIYGILGTAAAVNKPGARNGNVSWTDAAGYLWLFGGISRIPGASASIRFSDLWKYNPSTNQWVWIKGDSAANQGGIYGMLGIASVTNNPGARNGSVSWTDAAGNFWLFGGNGRSTNTTVGDLNDLWKYNPATNEWTWVKGDSLANRQGIYGTIGTADAANKPGGRAGSARWTDAEGNFWLFGGTGYTGQSNYGYLNDLWKYNPTTNQWTWVNGTTLVDQKGIYGTLGTPAAVNIPGARSGGVTWTDASGNFWLFGGTSISAASDGIYLNDLWKYNPPTNQWAWIKGDSTANLQGIYGTMGMAAVTNKPGARSGNVTWTDAAGNFWLFGGYNSFSLLNDLWKLGDISILPLISTSVKAYQQNNNIVVEWKVENQSGVTQYDIEKSTDGIRYAKAGTLAARGGNISSVKYTWLDVNALSGTNFYRLGSISHGGETTYSQVLTVVIGKGRPSYQVYPNPITGNFIILSLINQAKGIYTIRLYNPSSQLILKKQIIYSGGSSAETISLGTNITRGSYLLQITGADRSTRTINIIY